MLIDYFTELNPIYQALIATLFTWFMTALGAGLVFFFKSIKRKALDAMLGFAAGVMGIRNAWYQKHLRNKKRIRHYWPISVHAQSSISGRRDSICWYNPII